MRRALGSASLLASLALVAWRGDDDAGAAETARLHTLLHRFEQDERLLRDFAPLATDALRERRARLIDSTRSELATIHGDLLRGGGRVDLHLFEVELAKERTRLQWDEQDARAATPLLPFLARVLEIEALDRAGKPWPAEELAAKLAEIGSGAKAARASDSAEMKQALADPAAVRAASSRTRQAHDFLEEWQRRNTPADPALAFWTATPAKAAIAALAELKGWLDGEVLDGLKRSAAGSPFAIGRERYATELRFEGIDLSPEEMLAFGEAKLRELQDEMTGEARRLAGDLDVDAGREITWREGLELVKADAAGVGEQRAYVQSVAEEAIRFAREQQLFPIPELAEECWRLKLSDLETQKTYAYGFYGGNFMGVATPVPDMDHERKLECMRSNNRAFTRTVVPHELIPGHHLQGFFAKRFEPQRARFESPFFLEGWAVHTEMTFDEHGFFRGPRERLGHLFWRLLRAARIVVSTKYHLHEMTQAEMVDFMVENAGLERSAAQAEVDRYMTYSPLYQCAYLYGATQIRALREECRKAWGAEFSELRFNTELLEQGTIAIAFAREALLGAGASAVGVGGARR